MYSDSSKQGYDNHGNANPTQYPPMQQPQFGTGYGYPPHNLQPSYSQYPQPTVVYPAPGVVYQSAIPVYQQQAAVVVPFYRPFWYTSVATTITPALKAFLIISGILYLMWGISLIGLEIGIIVNSTRSYYVGFVSGGLLISGGVSMLVAACRPSYIMIQLVRMFTACLVFCIVELFSLVLNYSLSSRCLTDDWDIFCDWTTATNIKVASIAVAAVSTVHTIVNLAVASSTHRGTMATSASQTPSS